MDELMTARSLTTRPVVTLGGDAVASVKDTVLDAAAGRIAGFTLTGRGLSGPLREALPWASVHALGHDAVMVRDRHALVGAAALTGHLETLRSRVLGAKVLTEGGAEVGSVLDVVVEGGTGGRVVGFRVAAVKRFAPGPDRRARRVYLPRGEDLAFAGRTLVLPDDTVRYVAGDLAGFAALLGSVPGGRGARP
ncbi:PRC-barrel domain-containing protein [Streptomyces sp. NPDC003717]|uniref:PRC-barrel domain-containing protein n=1 Tax=Streptomyces sp. NPDC003717 TaxID=3154276 RepID=UPI0033A9FAD2